MSEKGFTVILKCEQRDKKYQECEYYIEMDGVERPLKDILVENEQLWKENERLGKMNIELLDKVIVNLRRENEQLRKDLNKLYNLLMDKGMSHNELQDVLWGD